MDWVRADSVVWTRQDIAPDATLPATGLSYWLKSPRAWRNEQGEGVEGAGRKRKLSASALHLSERCLPQ